jgi:hypothetical protein
LWQFLHRFCFDDDLPPRPDDRQFLQQCADQYGEHYKLAATLLLRVWQSENTEIRQLVFPVYSAEEIEENKSVS